MSVSLHPHASRDLTYAVAHYRLNASAAIARRFVDEFERVKNLLDTNPDLGTPFDLPRRVFPLRGFPYSVVYRPVKEGLRVLAVRHQHRAPSFGNSRR